MNRKIHKYIAWVISLPFFIILATGIILQIKKNLPWIQPKSRVGTVASSFVGLDTLLSASRTVPDAKVSEWKDIRAIDLRPSDWVARVRTRNHYEISIDLGTGTVLQSSPRRTGWLIELHEGSCFGDWAKYGVYLPVALLLFILWGSGVVLLIRPTRAKKFL